MHLNLTILSDDGSNASIAQDKLESAATLLADVAPTHARWVARYVQGVSVMDLPSQRFLALKRGCAIDAAMAAKAAAPAIALLLLSAALRVRLAPFLPRRRSGDRHAQYWWRLRTELQSVARAFDQAEDPTGYIMGVSHGRFEEWIGTWLAGVATRRDVPSQSTRRLARDLRRMELPWWLIRPILAAIRWRSA
jgi:hypothetical protein